MYDTIKDLLDALRATPDTLNGLVGGCTDEEARFARGGDENWSVVEVMCHLRDACERALERMRLMRDEDNPLIASYDQEQWARERNYAAAHLQDALQAFISFRAAHVAELAALRSEDWQRTGRHAELGRITIEAHTLHVASHDAVHLAQIARQLISRADESISGDSSW